MISFVLCTILLYVCIWESSNGQLTDDGSVAERAKWERFRTSSYLFVFDADRDVDTTRQDASFTCKTKGSRLVSINSDEELAFLQRRIRDLVEGQGQRFALEQWWTSGSLHGNTWVWEDEEEGIPIKMGISQDTYDETAETDHFVGLIHNSEGWTLELLPENYRLRYICERDATTELLAYRPPDERLLRSLFLFYDADARGLKKPDLVQTINAQLQIQRVNMAEDDVLETSIFISLGWLDERLYWSVGEFGNVTNISVKKTRVWSPDVMFINGLSNDVFPGDNSLRCYVTHEGHVHLEARGKVNTPCYGSSWYYPFDSRPCQIKIGLASYNHAKVNITSQSLDATTTNSSFVSMTWDVLDTDYSWDEITTSGSVRYPHVIVTLQLQRRGLMSFLWILLPSLLFSLGSFATFWLPRDTGEGATFSVVMLAAFTLHFSTVADGMPSSANTTPCIGIYMMGIFAQMITVCITAVGSSYSYRNPASLPACLRKRLLRRQLHTRMPNLQLDEKTSTISAIVVSDDDGQQCPCVARAHSSNPQPTAEVLRTGRSASLAMMRDAAYRPVETQSLPSDEPGPDAVFERLMAQVCNHPDPRVEIGPRRQPDSSHDNDRNQQLYNYVNNRQRLIISSHIDRVILLSLAFYVFLVHFLFFLSMCLQQSFQDYI